MIYEEKTLKDLLMTIDNNRVVMDDNFRDIVMESMLAHIGSLDPVLRDQLIYSKFVKLIGDSLISQRKMASIFDTCLDQDHLFYRIGETNTDSVFTRSFSSLVIALILTEDSKTSFIDSKKIQEITKTILRYLHEEKDTRGFVEDKGWAHSIAHGADMLAALVNHIHFPAESFPNVHKAIQECLLKGIVYRDEEEERLIFVVEALLERGLEQHVLNSWIKCLSSSLEKEQVRDGQALFNYRNKITVTNFMKAFYFRLKLIHPNKQLLECLESEIHYWFKKSFSRG